MCTVTHGNAVEFFLDHAAEDFTALEECIRPRGVQTSDGMAASGLNIDTRLLSPVNEIHVQGTESWTC